MRQYFTVHAVAVIFASSSLSSFACGSFSYQGDVEFTPSGYPGYDNIYVGNTSPGHISLSDGALLRTQRAYLGWGSGVLGTARITGAGTYWQNPDFFNVGRTGIGELIVESGARLYTGAVRIGKNADVVIQGSGTQWTTYQSFTVGEDGSGDFAIKGGAKLQQTGSFTAASSGSFVIDGPGSVFEAHGFTVAYRSSGSLTLSNGGRLATRQGFYCNDEEQSTINIVLSDTDTTSIDVGLSTSLSGILNVQLASGYDLQLHDRFTLMNIAGTRSGAFENLIEGDILGIYNGLELRLTYEGGDGNDLVAFAIPSSASTVPFFLASILMPIRRRR